MRDPLRLAPAEGTIKRHGDGVAMRGCWLRRIADAAWRGVRRSGWFLAAAGTLALAACTTDGQPTALGLAQHGASVAFDSIDGPPQGQFYKLVQDLNDEAQARQLTVISRERSSTYRVRGYLAAKVTKGQTTISWVWDVFDADGRRALRIDGEEAAPGKHRDAWAAADDAVLQRIARASVDQLAVFLTSPDAAPAEAPSTVASAGEEFSPEAAGIFRIFQAVADPLSGTAAATPAADVPAEPVPLPRRRPTITAAAPARETVAVAASNH